MFGDSCLISDIKNWLFLFPWYYCFYLKHFHNKAMNHLFWTPHHLRSVNLLLVIYSYLLTTFVEFFPTRLDLSDTIKTSYSKYLLTHVFSVFSDGHSPCSRFRLPLVVKMHGRQIALFWIFFQSSNLMTPQPPSHTSYTSACVICMLLSLSCWAHSDKDMKVWHHFKQGNCLGNYLLCSVMTRQNENEPLSFFKLFWNPRLGH